MNDKSQIPPSLKESAIWKTHSHPIWPATLMTLQRNLSKHPFPHKLTDIQSKQVVELIKQPLLHSPFLNTPQFLTSDELSPNDKQFTYDHFLLHQGLQQAEHPYGLIIDDTASFIAMINIEDHLTLHLIETHSNLYTAWHQLMQIENKLGSVLDYSFTPNFGYLTSAPAYCGTALTIQSYLHLPALIHMNLLKEVIENELDDALEIKGLEGTHVEFIGDLVILQNKQSLGIKEDAIIHEIQSAATKLILEEKKLRKQLKETPSALIKDKVSRAYGLLSHSYQLETKEAFSSLSLLKLGISLDWIQGIEENRIDDLFFNCRRSHLLLSQPQELKQEEYPHLRAQYLQEALKNIEVKI